METYQRRKYKNNKENYSDNEIQYSKDRDQSRLMSTVAPTLARHGFATPPPLPPPPPPADCTSPHQSHSTRLHYVDQGIQMVAVGSLYEIDHIHLPPRTPVQLRSIRVAMVSEKTQLNLAVRYPSIESLKSYFHFNTREMYPELDEKFVMGTALASKVLFRQIPSYEFTEKKHMVDFWLMNSENILEDSCSNKGSLISALKCNGMVRWGTRRQVKFLEKHMENVTEGNDLSLSNENEEKQEDDNDEDDNDEDEEDEEEEESETDDIDFADEKPVIAEEMNGTMKRKRYMLRKNSSTRKKAKKIKCDQKKKLKKPRNNNKCRDLVVFQDPKDRWSAERYKLATRNLLEVMKSKGATASNPIIRPDLRAEARKKIGDTGLLDHLLKHMAGKLAPDGENRFRRRHNADGAMEYWLENAELVDIRKKAGVTDPYWTPPPGWKPGDSPTQDPVCAMELRKLKEEILDLKRKYQEMVPRKFFDEEITKLRREIEKIASGKTENKDAEVLTDHVSISQKLDQLANSLVSSKSHITNETNALQMYEQQLMVISDLAKGIEEEMKKLLSKNKSQSESTTEKVKSKSQGETTSESALIKSNESTTEKELKKDETEEEEKKNKEKQLITALNDEKAEEKAAKIQRLKSGFRICKPQGTFLWPPPAAAARSGSSPQSQVVVQVEDLLMVPTPPSVTSSNRLVPPQLPNFPISPVKPLAERRAITVTVSTLADQNFTSSSTTTTTTTTSPPINLNDVPSIIPSKGFSDSPSARQTTSPTGMPPLEGEKGKHQSKCCSSSASCFSSEVRNWLALSTSTNYASDESNHG